LGIGDPNPESGSKLLITIKLPRVKPGSVLKEAGVDTLKKFQIFVAKVQIPTCVWVFVDDEQDSLHSYASP